MSVFVCFYLFEKKFNPVYVIILVRLKAYFFIQWYECTKKSIKKQECTKFDEDYIQLL